VKEESPFGLCSLKLVLLVVADFGASRKDESSLSDDVPLVIDQLASDSHELALLGVLEGFDLGDPKTGAADVDAVLLLEVLDLPLLREHSQIFL
jgi:hypothetical protein